jgi:TRAP-type C4-dicarboxylate transport system permease small subunit
VSESADDEDAKDAKVRKNLDVPATRKQDAVKDQPTERASASQLDMHAPLTYPDDGPVSGGVRKVDNMLGKVEQVTLVAMLGVMILVCAADALLDKLANSHVELKEDVIIFATFGIAMIGTAFATQQARNLAMDLISRRLSPRARLVLKVILTLFTMLIVGIVIRAGMHNLEGKEGFPRKVAWLIPVGGGLIVLHSLLHLVIDVDYLKRGKTPPERMRSGH